MGIAIVLTLVVCVSTSCHKSPEPRAPVVQSEAGSLIAHINGVTVLELQADKPITQYRLLVNDEPHREGRTHNDVSKHLYLAAVSAAEQHIHMKIGNANYLLVAPISMSANNNMQQTVEYVPPKKEISIDDWTTIYGITIKEYLDGPVVRSLKVQIK